MEKFRNKVVATDYVEKNYTKKAELEQFINTELEMVERSRDKIEGGLLDGISAAYNCILATFIKE